ncbi:LPS ABC transporter substrate-binding protein LptA [Pseudodesulfovibrio sp.]|nr:LPS ABC transporter substrate-binding protein LptA [Pseudodesulfovibrio sp.]
MAWADWGEIREAALNLNVRSKRTPKSEHIVTLAKGQRVKVDFLKDGWVAIFNLNESKRDEKRAIGYANVKYLTLVTMPKKPKTTPPAQKAESAPSSPKGDGVIKAEVAATPPPDIAPVGIDPSRTPVKITSDRMVYDENGKVVSFVGNVVAVHGDLTLWANKLSAYLTSKTDKKFAADSIDRIVAEGDVRAKKGKSEGTCGLLTYYVEKQMLKMERNPKLQDGPNSLAGETINFYVRENRSEVVGGKGKRVKAIFMTPENIKVP